MNIIKQLIIICIAILSLQSKAQVFYQSIVDLQDRTGDSVDNTYYKDTNNLLNNFEGSWIWDDGTHYLKLVLQKKEMVDAGNYIEDLLVGEFQYKENGVELMNTLHKLTQVLPSAYSHSIDGNYIKTALSPFSDYTDDDFWIDLTMSETNGYSSSLGIRLTSVDGQEAIQIFKNGGMKVHVHGEPEPEPPIIPNGFHYLIKE